MSQTPTLVRALGRWSFTAILLNIVIGASAFGLPSEIAAQLGPYAPWAYFLGGLGILMIGMCFAEVASYFEQAGGPYLYAREAYGQYAGIYIAYLLTFVRIAAASGIANLFSTYLGQFFPGVDSGWPRAAVLTAIIAVVLCINIIGVKMGAGVSNTFAVLKVGSLAIFAIAGIIFLTTHGSPGASAAVKPITVTSWLEAFVLVVFGYGGFEAGLVPASEAKNARKDAPVAVFATLGIAILLYTLVQVTVTFALPNAAATKRPVAEAARIVFGSSGPEWMSIAAIIAICGYLMASILAGPRVLFAMAEHGEAPAMFGKVHERFRTPHVALIGFCICVWILTIYGSFRWGVFVSSVTRLLIYASVCGAVFMLRRSGKHAGRRVPFSRAAAVAGIAFCALLISRMGWQEWLVMAAVALAAWLSWLAAVRAKKAGLQTA
jgi:basic amino acid/polyamine antiporter, APA family